MSDVRCPTSDVLWPAGIGERDTSWMLRVDSLSKRYGTVLALDRATFVARAGRIVGFLGPNGAGKTTTMRCIFGLTNPDSGYVTWNDAPIDPLTRLRFGYMPEERGLYPKMRIAEQLAYFGRLSGLSPAAANDAASSWLQRLGLADRALSKLEELSHGNQQRVQLAAALVHEPELAVLDEPFSGLDPLGVEAMALLLKDLATTGVAILFSSHQLDLVEGICEDVVIINEGRVVLAGELDELRSRSKHRHVEITVDGVTVPPPGDDVLTRRSDSGQTRYLIEASADPKALLTGATAQGTVDSFVFEPPSLGDLFREAVAR